METLRPVPVRTSTKLTTYLRHSHSLVRHPSSALVVPAGKGRDTLTTRRQSGVPNRPPPKESVTGLRGPLCAPGSSHHGTPSCKFTDHMGFLLYV